MFLFLLEISLCLCLVDKKGQENARKSRHVFLCLNLNLYSLEFLLKINWIFILFFCFNFVFMFNFLFMFDLMWIYSLIFCSYFLGLWFLDFNFVFLDLSLCSCCSYSRHI